jgi:hypothetical protein
MKNLYLLLLAGTLVLSSCGDSKNRTLEENLSAYLQANDNAVVFGKVDVNQLKQKGGIANIPIYGPIIGEVLKGYQGSLNINAPVFFAMEGPFDINKGPGGLVMFAEVKDKDSLVKKLTQQGFDVNEQGDISIMQDGDMGIGIRNNLAIVAVREKIEAKILLPQLFEQCTGDLSEDAVNEMLKTKSDIVVGVDIDHLFEQSMASFSGMAPADKKKMNEVLDDSYVCTGLTFETGAVRIASKNYFNEALKKFMFLKSDPSAKILKNLGTGNPKMGLSMNFDLNKLEQFINENAPGALGELARNAGSGATVALATGGDKPLSSLLSGEIGAVVVGEPHALSEVKDFNFFIGLGPKGKAIFGGLEGMLSLFMKKVVLTNNSLSAFSSESYAPQPGKKMELGSDYSFFGKKGMTAFLDVNALQIDPTTLRGEEKLLTLVKNVTMEMDNDGMTLMIRAKDAGKNALKQIVDLLLKEMGNELQNLAM